MIVCLLSNSLTVFADYDPYVESQAYTEVAYMVEGCETIGAFIDYKSLVDRQLRYLVSMSSAERQQLVTEILTSAGAVYVNGDYIDFTDGELGQYILYAITNVAEAKRYLKHYGMSSIADVPLTIDFGDNEIATVKMFRSFLANAYNCGISDILIKNNSVGFVLNLEELASALTEQSFAISLMQRNITELNQDYRAVLKSEEVYQLILSEDEELYNVLPNSKVEFYNTPENSRIYCLASDMAGVKAKLVSSEYDGFEVSANINSRRWFGIYSDEISSAGKFLDVPSDHWAYDYIDYLAANEIVSGCDGRFNPDDYVTREEFVKILIDAFDLDIPDAQCEFADVRVDDWFYKYIASANSCDIVAGVSADSFGVGESVSRQDISVMIVRAFECKQLPMEPVITHFGYFFDADTISDYAQDAVMSMYVSGFVTGDEDYRFNPHLPATRAEVAKIIYMIMDYMERI